MNCHHRDPGPPRLAIAVAALLLAPVLALSQTKEPAAGKAQTKVVIVPMSASGGIDPKAAEVLASVIVAELSGRGIAVVTSKDVETALGVEHTKQTLGAKPEKKLDDLAGALGGDKILTGSVAALGRFKVITIQLFDTRSGSVERVFQEQLERAEEGDLLEAAGRAGDQLFPGAQRTGAGARRLEANAATIALRSNRAVTCTVDGGLPALVAMDQEVRVPVNPGKRVIRCAAQGLSEFVKTVEMGAGATTSVQVEVHDLAAARSGKTWGYLSLGLAAAGAGVAGYGYAQAHSAYSSLHGASAPTDPAARQSKISQGQMGNTLLATGLGVGAVGAVLASYYLIFSY